MRDRLLVDRATFDPENGPRCRLDPFPHAGADAAIGVAQTACCRKPLPIPHNSDQLRQRECDCPHLPNKRERAYDNSSRNV
jgi:hypothetical protein